MTRSISFALATAALLAAATPVFAGDAPNPTAAPAPDRVVMLCASDAVTVRAWRREHGSRPVFVTADQVMAARTVAARWSAPRCMTAREHGRLVSMMTSRS